MLKCWLVHSNVLYIYVDYYHDALTFVFQNDSWMSLTTSLTCPVSPIRCSWHSVNRTKRCLVKLVTKIRWLCAIISAAACNHTTCTTPMANDICGPPWCFTNYTHQFVGLWHILGLKDILTFDLLTSKCIYTASQKTFVHNFGKCRATS